MPIIWIKLLAELEAGRSAFFVLVVASTRGSPGTTLSSLLITQNGKQLGTIGGGCMEGKLLQIGRQALITGDFVTQVCKLDHRDTGGEDTSGLICGGSQTNLLALLTPSHQAVIKEVVESINNDRPGTLSISETTWKFEAEHRSEKIWLEKSGNWQVNLSILNRKRIAIFGGGHCGVALAQQMLRLGFKVTVIEPRSNLFTLDNMTKVKLLQTDTFAAGATLVSYPEISFVVVLTPSARQDVDALSGILNYPFPYIGVMGSRSKLNMIQKLLQKKGLEAAHWERITSPVGVPIGSDTPEEIAVSISAQILLESRKLGLR